MKKLVLKIIFSPLLLLWIIIVPLFKLLNKFYPAPIWNWRGIYLVDTNQDINLKIKDDTEGSEAIISIYWNNHVDRKFIHILAENKEIGTKVYINTEISNLELDKK
jgi:hypothetical protein